MMKDIKEYEGVYKVTKAGDIYSVRSERFLKLNHKRNGYVYVELNLLGKARTHRVHRLVAEAFVENSEGKEYVNHLDGDKSNNHYSNLEWVTASENNIHAFKNKLSGVQMIIYDVFDKNNKHLETCYGQEEVLRLTGIRSKQTVQDASTQGYLTQSGHYIQIKERSTTRLMP